MSDTRSKGERDGRGRFLRGHTPLLGAGRPLGSIGLGKIRPLVDMMKQAAESEMLVAAAEAKPSVAALLRRRRSTAERVRRHRERQRNGLRIARVHFAARDIAALVEGGFLPEGQFTADDFERAVYELMHAALSAQSSTA